MSAALKRNYDAALADATRRGVAAQTQQLEILLQGSVATLNIDAKLLRNMAFSQNYMSYYRALDRGLRQIAEQTYHAHRSAVDAKIHTGYETEILNAALSPDGCGLTNYGAITLQLQEVSIDDRTSVMRENAFNFYERYRLGDRDAEEEPGWRSTWADRSRLGVAHLAPAITPATAIRGLADHILFCGPSRHDDRYIEVHVFGELTWQALGRVTLEKPLTNAEDQEDWEFGRQKLAHRGVTVIDRVTP